jgi:hypothetical protein
MNTKIGKALACAILAGILARVPAQANTPMTFFMELDPKERLWRQMTNGVEDIFATGEITDGTTDRLLTFVREHKVEAAKIHFNSPGGSLAEGMKLGQAIRTLQFYTTVGVYNPKYEEGGNLTSICASACAYAFAGGTSRFLNEYTGKLGIHQFYTPDDISVSGETVQQVSGLIVAYLDEMGVDAKAFTISTIADRNGMIWLSPENALKLRFANNGNEAPVAEIKLAGMNPYLRVQQDHHNVSIRILFSCKDKQVGMMFGIVSDPTSAAMFAENQKRSYLELDHKEFLITDGKTGATANDSVTWIDRNLTPIALAQIVKSNSLGGWIDGFGAVRFGGTLDIPTVSGKIADYAKQCYAS